MAGLSENFDELDLNFSNYSVFFHFEAVVRNISFIFMADQMIQLFIFVSLKSIVSRSLGSLNNKK